MKTLLLGLACCALMDVSLRLPKYGVQVTVDKRADLSRLRTYTWTTGWSAYDRTIDRQIVTAVDRELAAAGLQKLDAEPADALVTYGALQRVDVDTKSKISAETNLRREVAVGTLVVLLLEPQTRRELLRARADAPLELEPSRREAQFGMLVAKMFAKYPGRKVAHR